MWLRSIFPLPYCTRILPTTADKLRSPGEEARLTTSRPRSLSFPTRTGTPLPHPETPGCWADRQRGSCHNNHSGLGDSISLLDTRISFPQRDTRQPGGTCKGDSATVSGPPRKPLYPHGPEIPLPYLETSDTSGDQTREPLHNRWPGTDTLFST